MLCRRPVSRATQKIGFGEKHKERQRPQAGHARRREPHVQGAAQRAHMEAMFRHAAKARFDLTAMWIGEKFCEAAMKEAKPNPAHFQLLREIYEPSR